MTDQTLPKSVNPSASFGEASAMDPRAFRNALGSFATGVTVVTSGPDLDGCTGTTINAFSALSLDPALVLICLKNDSNSLPVIRETGLFAVHILAADQQDLAMACASKNPDKMKDLPLEMSPGQIPAFDQYLTRFECRLHQDLDGGDHRILIGEVMDFDDRSADQSALTFFAGKMGSLPRPDS